MRFCQLDRIIELIPGERIVATRKVLEDEEFFRDHFPLFKVMPGVLMLEALFQASCWLVRSTENFEHSVLMLREAKNIKFADFMQPGQRLDVTAEIIKFEQDSVTIKASACKGDTVAVSGRLVVGKSNLAKDDNNLKPLDDFLTQTLRLELERLMQTHGDAVELKA